MNENLFEEIPATVPQHTRHIVVDDSQSIFVAYCTVCAWYSYTGDVLSVDDVLVAWATHLEKVLEYRNTRYVELDRLSPQPDDAWDHIDPEAGEEHPTAAEMNRKKHPLTDYADMELDPKGHPV